MRPRPLTIVLPLLLAAGMAQALAAAEPFRDPNLPLEQRVDDLVSRLPLDEKIAMLGQVQPAIPRLGIKAFTNFTEGLHGLGWVRGGSVTATTFPQSVGLGETWDPEILRQAGAVEGYEARVYFKKFDGARVGLAIRAPNVDLARDPRWGRTEESFGEDPYFVGKMSVGLIKGLQGDNPKYLLSAATMKHFLANSNEDGRTSSSSDFDERNLREYYLVPFQMGITEGNAQSFMASYNAVNNGVNPKIETRKLGTIFIEWEGTQIVRKEPCLYQGVQGGRGAADTRWRERERLAPGGPDQTQRAVPLARCVPQGWGSGIAAAGGPAAGSPESAAAGCQSGGGRCAAGGGVGAQNWSTSSGYRFFAKSLQACKGIASEEHSGWRDSIYGEIRSMMQLEGFQAAHACDIARVPRPGSYRHYEEHEPRQADVALRDLIQQIVLENRFYGYRRVTAELDHRGVVANHKRVLRPVRADNLLVTGHALSPRDSH